MPDERFIVLHHSNKFRFIISRFWFEARTKAQYQTRERVFAPDFCSIWQNLALDRAFDHAFDDVFLRGEVEDHDWQNADDDQRHHSAQIHMAIAAL